MEEQELKGNNATDNITDLWDEKSDFLNNGVDDVLPKLDRWNNELKELLSDEERPPEHQTGSPEPVVELKAVEHKLEPSVTENVSTEPPRKKNYTVTDKQLILLMQKYKEAGKICEVAGITLETLQKKVGHLCYKMKKYIDVEGLYRETSPITYTRDGIKITTGHLVETDFKLEDRFRVDFKDKYIILTRLPKSANR